jgi:hypothetical protein
MASEKNHNSRKIPDFISHLESQCKGLENYFCSNAIGMISKKIDFMEKKLDEEIKKKEKRTDDKRKLKIETERIEALSNNFDAIKTGFGKNPLSPDISSSELIFQKIEENYKLLDELESSNRPIFSLKTENNNKVYVEDKIREMDSRLGTLFTAYRERCKSAGITSDSKIHEDHNDFIRDISSFNDDNNSNKKFDKEKEERLKELHEKLTSTEKKIKEIAGTILKNF